VLVACAVVRALFSSQGKAAMLSLSYPGEFLCVGPVRHAGGI